MIYASIIFAELVHLNLILWFAVKNVNFPLLIIKDELIDGYYVIFAITI